MSPQARTTRVKFKSTGKIYWIEYRAGFRGREFNLGGGWRQTVSAAREAAEKSNTLTEVQVS